MHGERDGKIQWYEIYRALAQKSLAKAVGQDEFVMKFLVFTNQFENLMLR